jgi:hypothetical protein
MPRIRAAAALLADRSPGARVGRLVGEAMSGALFADGTLLFAARWAASTAGPYTEVFRFEPDGRRCLVVDSARGRHLACWLHRFDSVLVTPIVWIREPPTLRVEWSERETRHVLGWQEPLHVGLALVTALLRRTPDRWLMRPGFSRLSARLLGPMLDIGRTPFSGRTETGVPVHLLARELQAVLLPTYHRDARSAGEQVPYPGGADLGTLSFTRRPILARGELYFVPPPAEPELNETVTPT